MKEKLKFILFALVAAFIVLPVHAQEEKTIKRKVAIGRFSNETQYGKGLFYDKENDPMRKQAMDILSSKLAASGKFILLERDDLDILVSEAGDAMDKVNADYIILGSITVLQSMGDTPESEISICSYEGEPINVEELINYYISDK